MICHCRHPLVLKKHESAPKKSIFQELLFSAGCDCGGPHGSGSLLHYTDSTSTASQQVMPVGCYCILHAFLQLSSSACWLLLSSPHLRSSLHWSWLLARSSHLSTSMMWYMFEGGLKLKKVFNRKYFTVVIKWKICSFNCCFVCCQSSSSCTCSWQPWYGNDDNYTWQPSCYWKCWGGG